MKKTLILIFVLLIALTVATACISGFSTVSGVVGIMIMIFAALKFLLVAFQFMELKKAHGFWKISLLLTLGILIVLIIVIK
ncbi:cytochrome C oxidase subunit IV family protein [Flavobacterium gilvum]|uniref:Cytochrome C oxidase subunit IV n=1 Tax=Flavobacterium gilvum TaxID=1492737 RepID=A0AAC9N5A2_9FLAO|nr:cytochrome C oxidase subunit IV family protein [Flavobacterium gilvum]AOW09431.1 hypothetical protein EM308_07900 [Flavobacterium gilvum]KFC59102.1 hypothetical protein FEM08_21160 [Flavobacterium gilvum]